MKKVLIFLATGFEEVEALAVVDILRRADIEVTMAGLSSSPIKGRNHINVMANLDIERVIDNNYDAVILPGGAEGTENLKNNSLVAEIVKRHHSEGKLVGAICAAPTVLFSLGLTSGIKLTSHPFFAQDFPAQDYSEERVVLSKNILTSRGPGTAMEFAFKILEILLGKDKVEQINSGVLAKL